MRDGYIRERQYKYIKDTRIEEERREILFIWIVCRITT